MSRKSEFRAWSEKRQKMYKVGRIDFNKNGISVYPENYQEYSKSLISDAVLEESTGLSDKNGVKIFENDIVQILYTDWISQTGNDMTLEEYKKSISQVGKVVYQKGSYVLEFYNKKFNSWYCNDLNEGRHGEKIVIGNIHQHKHLLK